MCSRGVLNAVDTDVESETSRPHHFRVRSPYLEEAKKKGSESPSFCVSPTFPVPKLLFDREECPNELSAPYEVPQFPIEQIESKLAIQRQLSSRRCFTPLSCAQSLGIASQSFMCQEISACHNCTGSSLEIGVGDTRSQTRDSG